MRKEDNSVFRADFTSVWNPLTRSLANGVLKQDLLDIEVATSFSINKFGNN